MIDASLTDYVIDVNDANFEADVLQRSTKVPVIVDFWAEWCGPCRQLGPVLEKAAKEKKGAFVLAKVNVDEAQRLAMYFRVESIPAVLAFKDGQAVNGFVGLVAPEELTEFIDTIAGDPPSNPVAEAAALEETDPAQAEHIYREAIAKNENDEPALVGLARVLLARGQDDDALATIANIPDAGEMGPEAVRIRRTVEMKKGAGTAGDEADLRRKIAAAPEDANLLLELGNVLATKGQYEPALETLIKAAELDVTLGRGAVRELMVKLFEIVGVRSELADTYRDKLRSLLY